MRYVLLILGFLLTIDLSAQTEKRLVELSGTISDKYPIKMILTIQNDKVLGYYYYEKYKTKILLAGQIKGTKITLNESPDYESDFKIGFVGEFNGNLMNGSWIDKDKNKTLNFNVSVDSDKKITIDKKITKIEGNYENVYSSDKYQSSVNLQYINESLFCFEVSNGTESGCVGYLKGLIDLKNLKSGIYSNSTCKELNISFVSDTLIITEKDCDWHGMNCPFDGKYKKK
jgi:hypothetical protein